MHRSYLSYVGNMCTFAPFLFEGFVLCFCTNRSGVGRTLNTPGCFVFPLQFFSPSKSINWKTTCKCSQAQAASTECMETMQRHVSHSRAETAGKQAAKQMHSRHLKLKLKFNKVKIKIKTNVRRGFVHLLSISVQLYSVHVLHMMLGYLRGWER